MALVLSHDGLLELAGAGRMPRLEAIRALVIHHSATPRSASPESIARHHVEHNRWAAVGYHWLIDSEGRVHRGRPLPLVGAHAHGRNTDTVGVCVIGNNADPEQRWSRVQVAALASFAWKAQCLFGRELELLAHREVGSTECPGMPANALRALLGL